MKKIKIALLTCFLLLIHCDKLPLPASNSCTVIGSFAVSGTPETVDSGDNVGSFSSLALDSNNKSHISYNDVSNTSLKYANNTSAIGVWSLETIDEDGGQYTSLGIDSSDNIHIAYTVETNTGQGAENQIKYVTKTLAATAWEAPVIVSSGGSGGTFNSLAIDSNNAAHIAFFDNGGRIIHATNATGSWEAQTVLSEVSVTYTSLAIDSQNNLYIAYFDDGDDSIKVVSTSFTNNQRGNWIAQTVDSTVGASSGHIDITFDVNRVAHLSYFAGGDSDLKYATKDFGSSGADWSLSSVDTEGIVGEYSSIVADASGNAGISYSDSSNNSLKFATNVSGSWESFTIDATLTQIEIQRGQYTSLAIDSDRDLHGSYHVEFTSLNFFNPGSFCED